MGLGTTGQALRLVSSQDTINRIQDLLSEGTLTGERTSQSCIYSPGLGECVTTEGYWDLFQRRLGLSRVGGLSNEGH